MFEHPPLACRLSLLFLLGVACIGCQQAYDAASSRAPAESAVEMDRFASEGLIASNEVPSVEFQDDAAGEVSAAAIDRKIIYTAQIAVVVEDFDGVEASIKQLVQNYGGYIADANLDRMRGERRSGVWTLRIPVEHFNTVLDAASSIGIPTSRSQNAQDVTEEFVDLEARLSNKRKLETRILELLERPDDKIQHVIEVERELARVREDIERMEGRRRYLQDRIALTTITLKVTEEQNYEPPQEPTLGNRIAKAWSGSIQNTMDFLEDTVVFLVGNAIPLIVWGGLALAAVFAARRHFRQRAAGTTERDR